jgi:hypothetical protein
MLFREEHGRGGICAKWLRAGEGNARNGAKSGEETESQESKNPGRAGRG